MTTTLENSPMKSATSSKPLTARRSGFRTVLRSVGLLAFSYSLAAGDVALKGTIDRRVINDTVEIRPGTSCVLNGTIIVGNLLVRRGARLVANQATIYGNVQAEGAALVQLNDRTRVGGDVQGKKTRAVIVRSDSRVGGHILIQEATAPARVNALLVQRVVVAGDIQIEKSSGKIRVIGNTIGGDLQIVENLTGAYSAVNNRMQGDLQFFKNNGRGVINGNRVGGNLQSKENSPAPVVRRNLVRGYTELK
jgi:hypothetical protein